MKRKPAAMPEESPTAGALELPVFLYPRPAFPGDPPPAVLPPRPLPEVLREVMSYCEWTSHDDRRPAGFSSWCLFMAARGLVRELAGRAAIGEGMAGAMLFDLGQETSISLHRAYVERSPGVLARARIAPEVPGFISRDRDRMNEQACLLDEIGQGENNPVPLVPEGKKRAFNPRLPKARLVACMFEHMTAIRCALRGTAGEVYALDPIPKNRKRLEEIRDLPELSSAPEAWKAWRDVSWRIVCHWTKGNPHDHAIFKRPPLKELISDAKCPLPNAHTSAWKSLARRFPVNP
jgi:hypothetical protein